MTDDPPTTTTQLVPLSDLKILTKQILQQVLAYPEEEATIITDILLYAQVRGNSQGVIKLVTGGVPAHDGGKEQQIKVEHESKLSARLNGHGISGMLVLEKAMKMAIDKAEQHGLSIVATHGTASGTGAIGYFARVMAEKGLIGIVLAQSPELVAPHGSCEAILGTNPFAIGIPRPSTSSTATTSPPLVLDMATSAYAWYALKEAKAAGESIPNDVAFDSQGHSTTDPTAALAGALRVFDRSYKGSHIALMVEILGGALAGGDVEDKWQRKNWGNLILTIDPEVLGQPLGEFTDKVGKLLERVKAARPVPVPQLAPGKEEEATTRASTVTLPGERSEGKAAQVLESGMVRMDEGVYREMKKLVGL